MWLPRFAYNDQGEILHIKQGWSVAGTWNLPNMFIQKTEKKDFSLAGVWVEYNPLANATAVTTKVNNMNGETNAYGFIANTKSVAMTQNDLTEMQKYSVGLGIDSSINEPTNLTRTILKITNENQPEPITAKAYYDWDVAKIKIEVTYRTHAISKILNKEGNILSENSTTADTGDEFIGNGTYEFAIIDNKGNIKQIILKLTDLNIFIIKDEATLKEFRTLVNAGKTNSSTKAYQVADIQLNVGKYTKDATGVCTFSSGAEKWTPIADYNTNKSLVFSGTYYGGNHTISGLYINNTSTSTGINQGLFGVTSGTIQDLGIIDSNVTAYVRVGSIIGQMTGGTVKNCYNTSPITGVGAVGGIVGGTTSGTITNCYNKGTVYGTAINNGDVGGIVGNSQATITNCYNNATITGSGSDTGGIAGTCNKAITNCYNVGNIGGTNVGGIVGPARGTISNCYNYGGITGGSGVGGIAAGCTSAITKCYNKGNVTSRGDVLGGIVGTSSNISNCINEGTITSTRGGIVGGIIGQTRTAGITITACYNKGNVTGYDGNGGIAGEINTNTVTMQYCYNLGKITGRSTNTGGISGEPIYKGAVNNCYNLATVTSTANFVGGIAAGSGDYRFYK